MTLKQTIVRSLSISCVMILSGMAVPSRADQPMQANTPDGTLSEMELKIWNSPDFKRQLAESYLSEIDIEPRVSSEEREEMIAILDLISSDQMNKAAEQLKKYLSRTPTASAVFDFTLANIYFQQEKLDEAAAEYQKAVEKYPKFRRAWKNLGVIYVRQTNFEKALPALTRVIELGGNDAITYGLLGFAYSSVENFLSAESAYRMAIMLDPVTLDWKMGLARSFFKQERFAEAVSLTGQLIETNPNRTDLWLLQANAYIGLNKPVEAAEVYELVDMLGGSTVDSLNMLGDIYVNEELYELASETYIRALDKNMEENADRAIRSAKILAARGALEETGTLVEKIESKYGNKLGNDERKDVLKLKGRLAVASGADDEEVKVLEEIVELDPLDGEALILLGQHSARTGDEEKAEFYYERAASIEKYEADAKIRHAQLMVANGKYTEALPLLRRAQQINYRENIQEYLDQIERVAKSR